MERRGQTTPGLRGRLFALSSAAVAVLTSIPGYVDAFGAAFPAAKNPSTYDNMAAAIGAFERKLITSSRFDEFLAGRR
jgi:cytochrome c peroxidase